MSNKEKTAKKKISIKKYLNEKIMLLVFCLVIFIPFVVTIIRGQKLISTTENRNLEVLPKFNFTSFFEGDFQSKLENALSDQYSFRDRIKQTVATLNTNNFLAQRKLLIKLNPKLSSGYSLISDKIYVYNNEDYLITKYDISQDKTFFDNISEIAKEYNKVKGIKKYLYFVDNCYTVNFDDDNLKENRVFLYIKQKFNMDGYARLNVDSYDTYKKYFYKTDHHWNYEGSYTGYKQIINMILDKNVTLIMPKKTTTFDIDFFGSRARTENIYKYHEKFKVYDFEKLNYKCYINRQEKQYGNKDKYYNGQYLREKAANHYGIFYGGDYGEVLYDFNNQSKQNILIIANSYSNAINDLIASHFNKTFVVDLRHYKKEMKEEFNIDEYIKRNDIDILLILGDIGVYTSEDFDLVGD